MVAEDINLDTGKGTGYLGDRALLSPVVGAVLSSVDKVAGVVASAVSSAVAVGFRGGKVGTELLGSRPKVVDAALLVGKDSAVGDQNTICANALARVWEVQAVVECERCVWILEAVQVPVCLINMSIQRKTKIELGDVRESST